MSDNEKNIAGNRKARHEYTILQTFEAGISLLGTEVKALRQGKANLIDSYATVEYGEVFLINLHIGVYDFGNSNNHDPLRKRKLLLHHQEIKKIKRSIEEKGYTLIPLRLYFSRGKVKVELAIGKGKKIFDKRHVIADRDQKRDLEREFKFK